MTAERSRQMTAEEKEVNTSDYLQKIMDYADTLKNETGIERDRGYLILAVDKAKEEKNYIELAAVCCIGATSEDLVRMLHHTMRQSPKLKAAMMLAVLKDMTE